MQIFAFPERQIVKVYGEDAKALLQKLISQDLDKLDNEDSIYSCLFTPQGRYAYDFIIFKGKNEDNSYHLDTTRAKELAQKLDLYKMRAKANIDILDDIEVFASLEQGEFIDPRHDALGYRLYAKPQDAELADRALWHKIRIQNGIFDGEQDAELERSNADELHINRINGIDWDKGCYIGQELTARMRYRSNGKKHLYIIEGKNLPENGDKVGKSGIMRSKSGTIGLALLRDDEITELPYNITKIQ